jgi:hypothetical protein
VLAFLRQVTHMRALSSSLFDLLEASHPLSVDAMVVLRPPADGQTVRVCLCVLLIASPATQAPRESVSRNATVAQLPTPTQRAPAVSPASSQVARACVLTVLDQYRRRLSMCRARRARRRLLLQRYARAFVWHADCAQ